MLFRLPLYPFLLALYFVFFVFYENLGEAFLGQTIRPIVVLLLVTGLLFLLFARIFRNADKAAFVSVLLLTLIFVHPLVAKLAPSAVSHSTAMLLLLETLVLLAIAVPTLRAFTDWSKLNMTLNLTIGVLLLMSVYRISAYARSDEGVVFEVAPQRSTVADGGVQRPEGNLPNIYFIQVDAYTRADTLQDYYGYDNSDFINYLEKTGFLVAHNGFANYHLTNFAVPSLLNFNYMADENGLTEVDSEGFIGNLRNQTFNNRTAAALKELGYRIVTVRSRTHFFNVADAEDFSLDEATIVVNEYEAALLDSTILPRLFDNQITKKMIRQFFSASVSEDTSTGEVLRYILNPYRSSEDFVFKEVSRQASAQGPMFLMAHLFVPHQSFLYGRNGEVPESDELHFGEPDNLGADVQGYADQVHYLNILVREMIDTILEKSATPPIIILQGDHGLRLTWWKNRNDPDPAKQLEGACLREMFSNLNALYLPGNAGRAAFYDSISPVNTFRLIFDAYFGGELGMLDDRSYFVTKTGQEKRITVADVTDVRETCDPAWEERFSELH